MRTYTALLLGVAIGVVGLAALQPGSATPDAGAAVDVVTLDPVRTIVSASPTGTEIVERTVASLESEARKVVDGERRRHLESIAADTDYLRDLGRRSVESLGRGGAAALAFPLYRVVTTRSTVTVYVTTIEVLPQSPSLSVSISHEDGHALINDYVAVACAPSFVREGIEAGMSGADIAAGVIEGLLRVGDVAHESYHESVTDNRLRNHERKARAAAIAATEASC